MRAVTRLQRDALWSRGKGGARGNGGGAYVRPPMFPMLLLNNSPPVPGGAGFPLQLSPSTTTTDANQGDDIGTILLSRFPHLVPATITDDAETGATIGYIRT